MPPNRIINFFRSLLYHTNQHDWTHQQRHLTHFGPVPAISRLMHSWVMLACTFTTGSPLLCSCVFTIQLVVLYFVFLIIIVSFFIVFVLFIYFLSLLSVIWLHAITKWRFIKFYFKLQDPPCLCTGSGTCRLRWARVHWRRSGFPRTKPSRFSSSNKTSTTILERKSSLASSSPNRATTHTAWVSTDLTCLNLVCV